MAFAITLLPNWKPLPHVKNDFFFSTYNQSEKELSQVYIIQLHKL